ncbi:hypothetical protein JK386_18050 [Nocardioides sp. zg-536]|uniref:Peptidylprolyl isomerase n=1 Tax=Nocardioides faecalis TaxID=2803858 RepID=A0A938YD38_9ACTN|nr:hypothetical protein [Nocardioides faecalis]MBM9461796.1 hypothetical protein [Nocardioides faecalis]MBS4751825.1 hypothetical protein [Nocardioides faecalis]QVI59315.1 hypothetical protein KG111_02800 [Nocardioides faecalis]
MTITKTFLSAATITALAGIVTACGTASETPRATQDPASTRTLDVPRVAVSGRYKPPADGPARDLIDHQAAVSSSASSINFETGLAEFLPRQQFSIDGGPPAPASRGILVGEIVSVAPGSGYALLDADGKPDPDAEGGTPVPFDDSRAMWRVVVVTVKVDHALTTAPAGGCDPNDSDGCTAQFGYPIYSADPGNDVKGLRALGDVVVVLDPKRSYPKIAKDLPAVARGGALLGDIDARGVIGFPALGEENESFVGAHDTVASLVKQAEKATPPVIRVTVDLETGTIKRG